MGEGQPTNENLPFLSIEDLEKRESYESSPDSYEVRKSQKGTQLENYLSSGSNLSGHLDLRGDVEQGDKYGIIVGNDHYNLAVEFDFPYDASFKDYNLGIVFYFDRRVNKIKVRRDSIGNPGDRDDSRILKIASAVEQALQRDLIDPNDLKVTDILERAGFKGYNLSKRNVGLVGVGMESLREAVEESNKFKTFAAAESVENLNASEPLDYIIVSNIGESEAKNQGQILNQIDILYSKLSDFEGATIRMCFPYKYDQGTELKETMESIEREITRRFPNTGSNITSVGMMYEEDESGNIKPLPVGEKLCLVIERR